MRQPRAHYMLITLSRCRAEDEPAPPLVRLPSDPPLVMDRGIGEHLQDRSLRQATFWIGESARVTDVLTSADPYVDDGTVGAQTAEICVPYRPRRRAPAAAPNGRYWRAGADQRQ